MESTLIALRERFLDAEHDFLSLHSDDTLEAFANTWEQLCHEFDDVLHEGIVDDALRKLVQSVSWRVASLSEDLTQLQKETNTSTSNIIAEVEDMLRDMTIDDMAHPTVTKGPAPCPKPCASRQSLKPARVPASRPPHLTQAYRWLVDNIHNPYPTPAVKSRLASQARVTRRTIDDWFKSIRRCIGWVSFVKRHFKGSRTPAVAATRNILAEDDNTDVCFEVAADFLAVKTKLSDLYSTASPRMHDVTTRDTLPSTSSRDPSPALSDPTVSRCNAYTIFHAPKISHPPSPSRPPSLTFASSDSEDDDQLPCALETITASHNSSLSQQQQRSFHENLKPPPDHTEQIAAQFLSIIPSECSWSSETTPFEITADSCGYSTRKRKRSGVDVMSPNKYTRICSGQKMRNPKAAHGPIPFPQPRTHMRTPDLECSFEQDNPCLYDTRLPMPSCAPIGELSGCAEMKAFCSWHLGASDDISLDRHGPETDQVRISFRCGIRALSRTYIFLQVPDTPYPSHLERTCHATDTSVSSLSPEAIVHMLDDILSSIPGRPSLVDNTSSTLPTSNEEPSQETRLFISLSLEEREDFNNLLNSSISQTCLDFNDSIWKDALDPSSPQILGTLT
uniref:A1 mating-type protein n=1 Tax=Phanerodontia chrysosporium TaxID=2822231 RepID=E7DAH2_PHACH|nr:A1 mating-type protein [Phanerodontia chrysosporium]